MRPPHKSPGDKPSPRDVISRIVVTERIYYQKTGSGESPTSLITPPFIRFLETDEQPLIKDITVGEEWIPLPTFWIERASLLHIRNKEGKFVGGNPTDEERAEMAGRIAEISFNLPFPNLYIPPGESMRVCPSDLKVIYLRCRKGKAVCAVSITPA